jgi:hypothetical protein
VKRVGLGLLVGGAVVGGVVTASVLAGTSPGSKPAPKPEAKPARLASGVKVGGIHVGGLSPSAAYAVIRLAYRSPVVVKVGDKEVSVSPSQLGATAYVWPAVKRAKTAPVGSSLPLVVSVRGADVRSFVNGLARRYDRKAVDAKVVLRDLKPYIFPEVVGRKVKLDETVGAIVSALRENRRGPIAVFAKELKPKRKASDFGPMVVIRRESKWLYFYNGDKFVERFRVATGQPVYPTPTGDFRIVAMWRNPWWYPPNSPWARGARPIPPGPGNPLGTRWMGLDSPGVGIHGTPDPASLGYSASHGCIRMYIPSAEWLFAHVKVGTPVFIRPV